LVEERKIPVYTKDQDYLPFAKQLNGLLFGSNQKNTHDKEKFLNLLLSTGKATLSSLEFKKFVQPLQKDETIYTLVVEGHKKYKSLFLDSADKRFSLFKMFIDHQIPYENKATLCTEIDHNALVKYLEKNNTDKKLDSYIEYCKSKPTEWITIKTALGWKNS